MLWYNFIFNETNKVWKYHILKNYFKLIPNFTFIHDHISTIPIPINKIIKYCFCNYTDILDLLDNSGICWIDNGYQYIKSAFFYKKYIKKNRKNIFFLSNKIINIKNFVRYENAKKIFAIDTNGITWIADNIVDSVEFFPLNFQIRTKKEEIFSIFSNLDRLIYFIL